MDGKKTSMDSFSGAHLEPLLRLFVDGLEVEAAHLLLARCDNAEAGTHCLCGTFSDNDADVPKRNPYTFKYAWYIWMKLLWHLLGHFADDKDSRIAARLVAVTGLEKVECTKYFVLDELLSQRLATMVGYSTQSTRCSNHDARIVARQVWFEVLVEAVEARAVVLALLLDEFLDGNDTTKFLVDVLAMSELEDPTVKVIVERGEAIALELRDDECDVGFQLLAGCLACSFVSALEPCKDAVERVILMCAKHRHGRQAVSSPGRRSEGAEGIGCLAVSRCQPCRSPLRRWYSCSKRV